MRGHIAAALVFSLLTLTAERLPVRVYTSSDGLVSDQVYRVFNDSRGYMWLGTGDGLSIFDGHDFLNFRMSDGLPGPAILAFAETGDGAVWVGTEGGLCRFELRANRASCDTHLRGMKVTALAAPRSGGLWAGTESGLFQGTSQNGGWRFAREPRGPRDTVASLAEDREGSLWVLAYHKLTVRSASGEWFDPGVGGLDPLMTSFADSQGRLWLGGKAQLHRIVFDLKTRRTVERRSWPMSTWWVRGMAERPGGELWVATENGLFRMRPRQGGDYAVRRFGRTSGLETDSFQSITADRDGNLWLAGEGAARIARGGFVTYTQEDGLADNAVYMLHVSRQGELYAVTGDGHSVHFSAFDGERFRPFSLQVPKDSWSGMNTNDCLLQAPNGDWWAATMRRLYRFPRVGSIAELERTPPVESWPVDRPLTLFIDSRQDVWISDYGRTGPRVMHLDRRRGATRGFSPGRGLPAASPLVIRFGEDSRGEIWALADGVATPMRLRGDEFRWTDEPRRLSRGALYGFHLDSGNRFLYGTDQGLVRLDDTQAARPRKTVFTTANGLSSDRVHGLVEDRAGRLYLATGRGLDRFDAATGDVKYYSLADGLPRNTVLASTRAADGSLWFGTTAGVSRLTPLEEPQRKPPPCYVRSVYLAGVVQDVPGLATRRVAGLRGGPGRNSLQVEFTAVTSGREMGTAYEYRLRAPAGTWQRTSDRSLRFAALGAGEHVLEVRAALPDGQRGETAVVEFEIEAAIWQTWWFRLAAAVCALGAAHTFYRWRLHRRVALERVRTRIATDLHDDIGASLTRIAVLSELAKRRLGVPGENVSLLLDQIAAQSRTLVESISDVVWSINPKRDHASDLAERVRDFAGGMLEPLGIRWRLHLSPGVENLAISFDARRNLLLIFKEAINNAARHSHCMNVELLLTRDGDQLAGAIRDDGSGFEANRESGDGHGLRSMEARAEALGGVLRWDSAPGGGTRIFFRVPVA
jgi:signal transduction histidine kinase/ligand-binding sensor domain-containing protein